MTGGGFGGCTVSLCRPEALDLVKETLASRFESTFGHAPVFHVSRAAQGASIDPRRE
jgi:galactokinase